MLRTLACLTVLLTPFTAAAQEPKEGTKPMLGLSLEVVLKKDSYVFDSGGKTPAEYKRLLEEVANRLSRGETVTPPQPLQIDLVLRITNTSNQPQTIFVGGDPNIYKFTLDGGSGVVVMNNPVAFTTDFRLPKAVMLAPGKSHDIPVQRLADGHRGFSRLLFWTGPGTYTLTATYVLSDAEGRPGVTLKSAPVKLVVKEKR